jgi:hypothetical protein
LVIFTLTATIAALPVLAASNESRTVAGDNEKPIRAAVERYLRTRATGAQSLTVPDFGRLTTTDAQGLATARREQSRAEFQIEQQLERDLRYERNDVTVEFDTIDLTSTAEAKAEVVETLAGRTELSPDIVATSRILHTIMLRRSEGRWLVATDVYTDELNALLFESDRTYSEIQAGLHRETAELQQAQAAFLARAAVSNETTAAEVSALLAAGFTRSEVKQMILEPLQHRLEAATQEAAESVAAGAGLASFAKKRRALNRSKAVSYAHKWAYDINSNYGEFYSLGGDCTNFVSQVVRAGGAPMDRSGDWIWFYDAMNPAPGKRNAKRSSSWSGVNELYDYLIGNDSTGPSGQRTSNDALVPADLVQLRKSGASRYFHSAIVVSAEWKWSWSRFRWVWEVLVACHDQDRDYYPIDHWAGYTKRYVTVSYYD